MIHVYFIFCLVFFYTEKHMLKKLSCQIGIVTTMSTIVQAISFFVRKR